MNNEAFLPYTCVIMYKHLQIYIKIVQVQWKLYLYVADTLWSEPSLVSAEKGS